MNPFSFADYKQVEASAERIARDTAPAVERIEMDALDDDDMSPETEDAIRARFAEARLLGLLLAHGKGWSGFVLEPAEGPEDPDAPEIEAPFTREYIQQCFAAYPGIALQLEHKLLTPYQVVASEGKGSAPLPGTATQAV